jgi:hypothetical protein
MSTDKHLNDFLISSIRAAGLAHLILDDLITLTNYLNAFKVMLVTKTVCVFSDDESKF